jgi:hypothetical protein
MEKSELFGALVKDPLVKANWMEPSDSRNRSWSFRHSAEAGEEDRIPVRFKPAAFRDEGFVGASRAAEVD